MVKLMLALSALSCVIAGPVSHYGPLRVNKNQIVGKSGKPVSLRGMSLFWSQWEGEFYNPKLINWLVEDWNVSVIRAAMAIENEGYLEKPGLEKNKVETVIAAAIKEDIYVVIDWHDHNADKHIKEAKDFFGEMANRYHKYPNIIYEIFNEPLRVPWSEVKNYAIQVIDEIRKYDSENLIVVGSPYWDQNVDEAAASPIDDHNTAYSLHFYPGTHKADIRAKAQKALDLGIALMVTEFGTTHHDGGSDGKLYFDETKIWLDWLDERNISWMNWSIADKEEASAALRPEASAFGDWSYQDLSESGTYIRNRLRSYEKIKDVKVADEESNSWFKPLKKK